MKKALISVLAWTGITVGVLLLVLRKGIYGPVIILALAVLLYGVTFASEFWKLVTGKYSQGKADGKGLHDRDRHA